MSIKGNYFSDKMYDSLKQFKPLFNNPLITDSLYDSKLKEAEKIASDLLQEFKGEDYFTHHNGMVVSRVILTRQTQMNPFNGERVRSVNIAVG